MDTAAGTPLAPPTGTPAEAPAAHLAATVLDSPDPLALAAFYRHLLGFETVQESPEWVKLAAPGGGAALSFQLEPHHRRPVWPAGEGDVPMQTHLDVGVEDLDAAVAHAVAGGAVLAQFQPQEDVRVLQDPDGHVFCLFLPGA